jgi:hypothetical protein
MPAKWSRRVFSFRFYEGKISVPVTLTSCAFRKSYPDVKPPTGAFTSRLSTGRSPFPSLDITTTVSGLLCWRDSHPLEWQLASLNGVAGFAAGGSSSDRKRSRPIRAFSATPHDGQRPCRTLAEDPGRTRPRAAYPRRCSSNASGLQGRNSARILGNRASSAGVARASIPAEIPGLRPSRVSPTPQLKRE